MVGIPGWYLRVYIGGYTRVVPKGVHWWVYPGWVIPCFSLERRLPRVVIPCFSLEEELPRVVIPCFSLGREPPKVGLFPVFP